MNHRAWNLLYISRFSFQLLECFQLPLYQIPGSDCCQRGPICSLRSQLANSSVCIRFINVLIKPRSPLFLPPNEILFQRSHSLSLFLSLVFFSSKQFRSFVFLTRPSRVSLVSRFLFPGDDLDPRPP